MSGPIETIEDGDIIAVIYGRPFSHWVIFSAVCTVRTFVDLWREADNANSI